MEQFSQKAPGSPRVPGPEAQTFQVVLLASEYTKSIDVWSVGCAPSAWGKGAEEGVVFRRLMPTLFSEVRSAKTP